MQTGHMGSHLTQRGRPVNLNENAYVKLSVRL